LLNNNIETSSEGCPSPLLRAIQKNYFNITKLLLSHGSNLNVFTENEDSLL
jgi:ankyrin repeat protein